MSCKKSDGWDMKRSRSAVCSLLCDGESVHSFDEARQPRKKAFRIKIREVREAGHVTSHVPRPQLIWKNRPVTSRWNCKIGVKHCTEQWFFTWAWINFQGCASPHAAYNMEILINKFTNKLITFYSLLKVRELETNDNYLRETWKEKG